MATISKPLTYGEWLVLPETEGVEEVVNGQIIKVPPNSFLTLTLSKIWQTR